MHPVGSVSSAQRAVAAPVKDRFEATFVVSPDPSSGDFLTLQDALAALPSTGGKIFVKAGTYSVSSTLTIARSNVQIHGEGMGSTVFIGDAAMTGNTPILVAHDATVGVARALTADASRGDSQISVSPADAASFTLGDYVLLFSNKSVDSEQPAKHAGEIKRITATNPGTGDIEFDDQIFDDYTLADAASLIRIGMLHNITLSDFSVTTRAASSGLKSGFTQFQFVDNLSIQRLEVHDAFNSGIHLKSVINAEVSDCYIHHISDVTPPSNERYGIVVGCASQNIAIQGCRFSHTRHAVTTGGSSGTNLNGVQRNIIVANCTSMLTDTAHFDTHEPAENVTFANCVAIGGIGANQEAVGFQMRCRNPSVVGCSVLQAVGKGVMLFGSVSSGGVISSNMIANVAAVNGAQGVGIFVSGRPAGATAGTSGHAIIGNVIKNCDGPAISNGGFNSDLVISNNVVENVNSVVTGAAIRLANAPRASVSGNNVAGSIGLAVDAPADAVLVNNTGYNPVGTIARPWPPTGGDLTNRVVGGKQNPSSGTIYTVRHSPKTIVVAGGTVSAIRINGTDSALTGGVFKLGIGESISVTFSKAPTTAVYAE